MLQSFPTAESSNDVWGNDKPEHLEASYELTTDFEQIVGTRVRISNVERRCRDGAASNQFRWNRLPRRSPEPGAGHVHSVCKIPGLRWAPAVAIIFLFVAFIVFHLVGCAIVSAGAKTKFIDVNLYERLILDGISGYIPSIVDKRFGHSKHLRKRNQTLFLGRN
jgi:hypothetical protein